MGDTAGDHRSYGDPGPHMIVFQHIATTMSSSLCAIALMAAALSNANAYTLPTGKDALVKWANSCQDYTGKSWCNAATAKTLLKNGADPNAVDDSGIPALHRVIDWGLGDEVVKAVIAGGAAVNQKDPFGSSPLMHLRHLDSRVLESLIAAGADINLQDNMGDSALMKAVNSLDPVPYVKALLAAGADVSLKGKGGETALSIAEGRLAGQKAPLKPGAPSGIVEARRRLIAENEEMVQLLKAAGGVKGGTVAATAASTPGSSAVGTPGSNEIFRPKCNVNVRVLKSTNRQVLPAGTVFYVCPDENSTVDRRIQIPYNPDLIGELDGWREYQFRPGVPVYARTTPASGKGEPVAGATAGTPVPATPTQMPVAPRGVEFVKTSKRCPEVHVPGKPPPAGGPGSDANLFVPEDFPITDEAEVRKILLYGAAGVRAICGAGALRGVKVDIWPVRAKSKVGDGAGGYFSTINWSPLEYGSMIWVSATVRYDQASEQYEIGSPTQYEAKRRERCAPLAAFFKRSGAQEVVSLRDLAANPFVYDGKIVAINAYFAEMISRSEAMFSSSRGQGDVILVTNVPATRFKDRDPVVLVGRVKGIRKQQTPMGGVANVTELAFVDAYEDEFEDYDVRPALAYAKRR